MKKDIAMNSGIPKEKLGECIILGKYPHLFSTPIFFTDQNSKKVNNGTLTLLETEQGSIGITCWHVIQQYKNELEKNKKLLFQMGDNIIGLENLNEDSDFLIDHDEYLDLTTCRLSADMLKKMKGKSYPEMGSQCASILYQGDVKKDDMIILGGLPGKWVEYPQEDHVRFETFSIVRSLVESAGSFQYSCQLNDLNSWPVQKTNSQERDAKKLLDPGGLSGGPVFIEVTSESGIIHYELAGIIKEGSFVMGSTTLILIISPAKFIQPNGCIKRDFAMGGCELSK